MTREPDIVEVESPNLLEDMFSYDLPPRIIFDSPIYEEIDGELVKFDPSTLQSRDIHITDTTFRDGEKSRTP